MIYRLYPSKDTTLYEDSPRKEQNTGKDEILEIGKFYDTDNTTLLGNSRALIQFDLTSISDVLTSNNITNPHYRLRLENVESREIQSNYNLFVYPLYESFVEGIGSLADTPINIMQSSWVNRDVSNTWDTENSTVGKPTDPSKIPSLQAYYDFKADVGNFELVDTIKGVNGDDPTMFTDGARLILSASDFGGGTAHLSASLDENAIYNIDFDFVKGTLSGVEFNVTDPNGTYLSEDILNFQESLLNDGTYNMSFTASMSGEYKLQFTYFDNNGSNGSAGSIDNFYLYRYADDNVLAFDQFTSNITTLPSTYFVNDGIENQSEITGSVEVKDYKLVLSSSDHNGAALNRKITLQEGADYTASFDLDYGNFPQVNGVLPGSIEFAVQSPDGRYVVQEDITNYFRFISSSVSPTMSFSSRESGEFNFRWIFFGNGNGEYSASLDNFKVTSERHDTTSSMYNDYKYDARWVRNEGGGTWYTSSFINGTHYKQTFNKYTDNLDIEVTDYVNEWLDGTRDNNGFIIKKSNEDEASSEKFGAIKFFSSDTNTIYPPVLELRWDDSTFDTGSLESLDTDNMILYLKNLRGAYKETSKAKIRVYGRERFPARTFSTTSNFKLVKYLPTTTYYSVVDGETDQVIIPFDTNYTKVSCDSDGNYFNFWFNGLQPERFYKFVFRVDSDGTTKYFDDNFYFKVVR